MPIMISHDVIDTKRPASRDRFGGAVRQAHHMREIERLTATNLFFTQANHKGLSLPGRPGSQKGVRTNLLFTMSNRTSGEPDG